MRALVFKGKVVQIEANKFPVHEALKWVNLAGLSPQPEVGWSYDGAVFTPPPIPPPLPPHPDITLKAALAGTNTIAGIKAAFNTWLASKGT